MKIIRIHIAALLATICAVSATIGKVHAQFIYTSGTADIRVQYAPFDMEFQPIWQVGHNAIINGSPLPGGGGFAPHSLIAQTSSTRSSPTGLATAMGVADGTLIYTAGSSTYQPQLGLSLAPLDPADWTGDITITLSSWTIPAGAGFSLFITDATDTEVQSTPFSTVDPTSTLASNSLTMTPGSHAHFDWGFTHVGDYNLQFTWTGQHTANGTITDSATFTLQVVPEVSTFSMLALGLLLILTLLHRRAYVLSG